MTSVSESELNDLLAIMQHMLCAADQGDWQALEELDSSRRAILSLGIAQNSDAKGVQLPVHPTTHKEAPAEDISRTMLIKEIMALDEKIIESAIDTKNTLLHKNREMTAQVKAKAVYAQTSLMS